MTDLIISIVFSAAICWALLERKYQRDIPFAVPARQQSPVQILVQQPQAQPVFINPPPIHIVAQYRWPYERLMDAGNPAFRN